MCVRVCLQAKKRKAGASADGLRFARRSAARTAAQVLEKTLTHHMREVAQEAEIAEGVDYRNEIKASIKDWAFRVRRRSPVPPALPLAAACFVRSGAPCRGMRAHACNSHKCLVAGRHLCGLCHGWGVCGV